MSSVEQVVRFRLKQSFHEALWSEAELQWISRSFNAKLYYPLSLVKCGKKRSAFTSVELASCILIKYYTKSTLWSQDKSQINTVPFHEEKWTFFKYSSWNWKPLRKLGYSAIVGRPVKTPRIVEESWLW